MRAIYLSVIFTTVLATSGCATTYMDGSNPLAVFGGYWSKPGPGKLTTVGFSANAYTTRELAAKHVLRRCAELAQDSHKPYFLIFESPVAAVANEPIKPNKQFAVFAFGAKPSPMIYMLPQERESPYTFKTQDILDAVK
jgi:hypothetical protein